MYKIEVTLDNLDEAKDLLKYTDYKLCLWDIAQDVFRPARKHGYDDIELNKLLNNQGEELVYLLEKRFYKILEQYNVNL